MNALLRRAGGALARFLSRPRASYRPLATTPFDDLDATLRCGDVLLVEGDTRIATAIKYLTQSTWSHAALCLGRGVFDGQVFECNALIEVDLVEGVRLLPASRYAELHTRICRPIGLSEKDMSALVHRALSRLGHRYDLRNVFDLARFLLPVPPVPTSMRRRLLVLGSGEPSRAICSTFIAQVFQALHYPILPYVDRRPNGNCNACYDEVLQIRHYSLFAPRDFDVSPYFAIVKPTLEREFDFRVLRWTSPTVPVPEAA
jgi:hypothetical protein